MKNIEQKFLAYLENETTTEQRALFEKELSNSHELKKDFEDFAQIYQTLKFMGAEKPEAPEGFELEVMKAIEQTSLVNNRSSIMKLKLFIKGLFNFVTAGCVFLAVIFYLSKKNNYSTEYIEKNFYELPHSNIGLAIILFSALVILASMLSKNIKFKTYVVPTFASLALITLLLRSNSEVYFDSKNKPSDCPPGSFCEGKTIHDPLRETLSKVLPGATSAEDLDAPKVEIDHKLDAQPQVKVVDKLSQLNNRLTAQLPKEESVGLVQPATIPQAMPEKGKIFSDTESRRKSPEQYSKSQSLAEVDSLVGPLHNAGSSALTTNRRHIAHGHESYAQYEIAPIASNTEQYNSTVENGFQNVKTIPLSTFSIDVDTASYSNIRRFLNNSQMPPKDAVRTEEMLNYFKYDYQAPQSKEVPFSVHTELGKAPWSEKNQLLHIGLKGFEDNISNLPASNLVFLIDVSGSMESPEKLPLLKQGLRLLVEQLRAQDRIALVVYAGAAGVVLDSKAGDNKQEILAAIENLQAGGSTAGAAGIELAYNIAKGHFIKDGNNRIILATDGDFNVGISNDQELIKLIEEKRKTGIFLSILGFGVGNYKDGKMEQLANKGNGNYAYIDNIHEAKKVLVNDFRGTIFAIAKDVKIQIEFNPAYVQAYRLIGYENRLLNKEDFNDDKKDAGELGAGHSVTALYEIVPVGVELLPSVDALRYQQVAPTPVVDRTISTANGELATVKLRYKLPSEDTSKLISQVVSSNLKTEVSNNFKFAAAVAQFGMLLRDSEHKGNASYESTQKLANDSKGEDSFGYRAEFIKMIETARLLKR
jgi:secreted protein with Ig-like and vWFA domain